MIVVMSKCAFSKMSQKAKKAIEKQNATFEVKDVHCGCRDCQKKALDVFNKSKGKRKVQVGQIF